MHDGSSNLHLLRVDVLQPMTTAHLRKQAKVHLIVNVNFYNLCIEE